MTDRMPEGPETVDIGKMLYPQNRDNSLRPGCYDLIFRREKTIVTPGKEAELEIFITGYGLISNAKLYFMPPAITEPESCWVEFDLGQKEDGKAHFGTTRQEAGDLGGLIDLSSGGLHPSHWTGPSLFFDNGIGIVTECGTPEAPVKVRLKIAKKVSTGDHELSFALTYYNGREWSMAYRTVSLHVPTLYERYEGLAWVVGVIVAAIATIASVVAAANSFTGSGSPNLGPSSPAASAHPHYRAAQPAGKCVPAGRAWVLDPIGPPCVGIQRPLATLNLKD